MALATSNPSTAFSATAPSAMSGRERIERACARLRVAIEAVAALVLAIDVLVVFCSVVWRYFLHDPFDWAEEVASGLLLLDRASVNVLGYAYSLGARNVYTKAPMKSATELRGVKVRVLPVPNFVATLKYMGAVATPIPFGEIYTALQTAWSTASSKTRRPCSRASSTRSRSTAC